MLMKSTARAWTIRVKGEAKRSFVAEDEEDPPDPDPDPDPDPEPDPESDGPPADVFVKHF